jgi:hypothetical protein
MLGKVSSTLTHLESQKASRLLEVEAMSCITNPHAAGMPL